MKKAVNWILLAAFIVFLIDWGIVGLRLLEGSYDITAGAYIGLVCVIVIWGCVLYRSFSSKCPHCGKIRWSNGDYCAHCGKKINL